MFTPRQSAAVFPGQGSQAVGMAAAFYQHRSLKPFFEQADDVLGTGLTKLMRDGPADTLTLTYNAQPALLTVSYVATQYLLTRADAELSDLVSYVAGHSLGEYSALLAAGVFDFETALKLVRVRGEAMQNSVKTTRGSMSAILGLDVTQVEPLCAEYGAYLANDNALGQVVISGETAAVEQVEVAAQQLGAKKVVRLDVSAPFHCPLIREAAEVMGEALASARMRAPSVPVVTNVTATPEMAPEKIRSQLVAQVTGRVRWRESMQYLAENGVSHVYELGSGKVLTGLAKRCDRRLVATALLTPEAIDQFLTAINTQ